MKGIIRKYYKEFLFRGLIVAACGPLVLAAIYGILGACGVVKSLSPSEVSLAIVSITILAFLAAGITVVYKIEELPLPSAIALHGIVLYICYAITYLLNDWIKFEHGAFLVFTAAFVVGYALIWCIIYIFTRKATDKLNKKFKN